MKRVLLSLTALLLLLSSCGRSSPTPDMPDEPLPGASETVPTAETGEAPEPDGWTDWEEPDEPVPFMPLREYMRWVVRFFPEPFEAGTPPDLSRAGWFCHFLIDPEGETSPFLREGLYTIPETGGWGLRAETMDRLIGLLFGEDGNPEDYRNEYNGYDGYDDVFHFGWGTDAAGGPYNIDPDALRLRTDGEMVASSAHVEHWYYDDLPSDWRWMRYVFEPVEYEGWLYYRLSSAEVLPD